MHIAQVDPSVYILVMFWYARLLAQINLEILLTGTFYPPAWHSSSTRSSIHYYGYTRSSKPEAARLAI